MSMVQQNNRILNTWRKYFADDPFCLGLWLLFLRALRYVRSVVSALIFRAPGVDLGAGCRIIGAKHIVFGRNFHAGRLLWLEAISRYGNQRFNPKIEIGNHVALSDCVHITCIHRIAVRDNVLMGSKIFISDHHHGSYKGDVQSSPDQPPCARALGGGGVVEIGANVWIGDNAVIIGPVIVGEGAVIAANAVVTSDVLQRTIVGGIPAKPLKQFNPKTQKWEKL